MLIIAFVYLKKFEWLTITTSTDTTEYSLISQKLLVQLSLQDLICEAQDLGYPSVSNYISMITYWVFSFTEISPFTWCKGTAQFDSWHYLKLGHKHFLKPLHHWIEQLSIC